MLCLACTKPPSPPLCGGGRWTCDPFQWSPHSVKKQAGRDRCLIEDSQLGFRLVLLFPKTLVFLTVHKPRSRAVRM